MPTEQFQAGKRNTVLWALLIVLSWVVLAFDLGRQPLLDVDEATYAEIARRMVESGNWLVPYFRGEPSFLKPPFYYWSVAVSFLIFSVSEFAVRFVSLFYGTIALLVCALMARRLFGRDRMLIAVLLLTTCPGFFIMVRSSTTDMTLTCLVAISLYGFLRGYNDQKQKPDRLSFVLLWGAAALGTLTKGPIGVGIPFGIIFLYLLSTRRLVLFRRLSWQAGVPFWSLIVLPWFGLCYRRLEAVSSGAGLAFLKQNLIFHNVQKFFESGHYVDEQGFFYLFGNFLWMFFPWVLPFLAVVIVRGYARLRRQDSLSGTEIFCLIWFFLPLAVFSLSKFKMPTYIAPCLMAASLLTAPAVADWIEGKTGRLNALALRWSVWLTMCGVALLIFLGLAVFFLHPSRAVRLLPIIALFTLLPLLVRLARRPASRPAVFSVGILTLLLGYTFLVGYLHPRISEYSPYRRIGAVIRADYPALDTLYVYRAGVTASLCFYSQKQVRYLSLPKELEAVYRTPGALMLMSQKVYDELLSFRPNGWSIVGRWPQYHVSRLTGKFLKTGTRPDTLKWLVLAQVNAEPVNSE